MLRVSTQVTGTAVDLGAINDAERAALDLPLGGELVRFAEAVAYRDADALTRTRKALLDAGGAQVLVDAAGVAANFQRMVRIADATGIPVDNMSSDLSAEIRSRLSLDQFASARNTPGALS